jgi:phosphoglycolate phosphatase-like HAD superfamily hydrolase
MDLILFDIDSTLLDSSRSGMSAMRDAGTELFGPAFTTDGIEYAGRLDPLIVSELLARVGADTSEAAHRHFRACYKRHLETRLSTPGIARTLRGVDTLIHRLHDTPAHTLGVLTGNYAETGRMKLRASGLDPEWFPISVFGDESPHTPPARWHLPPLGMERYAKFRGTPVAPDRVTVVGDTPDDVSCALANGCRVLGVATGKYSVEALRDHGATLALPDLSDTERVLSFLAGD